MHLAEAFYTKCIVEPLLPLIGKTLITPNMITLGNMILTLLTYYLAIKGHLIVVAVLIQVYLFLDVLDGNLARYKKMYSDLGKKLDCISDKLFYNLIFIVIGYGRVPLGLLLAVLALVNLYAIIPTFYIVPHLRRLKVIKRGGPKKWMMDRGYIIGMDLGTTDILMTVFLLIGQVHVLFIVLLIGYCFDLSYRLIELYYNERIPGNIKD